nr:hypothetical protein [Tanacetum cinerariifolium]
NQGRGLQASLEVKDSHVTLTPVNPDGQQQSSSVSSQFVTSLLNSTLDVGMESIFKTTSQLDVPIPTSVDPLPITIDFRGGASSHKYTTLVTKAGVADYGHIKWIEDLVPRTMWIQEPIDYDKHALWGVRNKRENDKIKTEPDKKGSVRNKREKNKIETKPDKNGK